MVRYVQVAVLRVRLEELEQSMESKASRLQDLEQDRERILQDHTDSSGLHSQALDKLQVIEHHIVISIHKKNVGFCLFVMVLVIAIIDHS